MSRARVNRSSKTAGRKAAGRRSVKRAKEAASRAPNAHAAARTRHEHEFALRLQSACDKNQQLPAYHHGRQSWVRAQLAARFDVVVSSETVSKWFTGVARPKLNRLVALSRLLEVDEAWLMFGVERASPSRARSSPHAAAQAEVVLLAGFIQLCGGHAIFPDPDDPQSTTGAPIDLHVIIKGADYALHVVAGEATGPQTYKLMVKHGYEERVVIGLIPRGPLRCDFIELETALLAKHGARRPGGVELQISVSGESYLTGADVWPRMQTFAQRI